MRVHHSSSRSGGVTVCDAVAFVDKMMAPPHERGCKEQAVSEGMSSVFLAWRELSFIVRKRRGHLKKSNTRKPLGSSTTHTHRHIDIKKTKT